MIRRGSQVHPLQVMDGQSTRKRLQPIGAVENDNAKERASKLVNVGNQELKARSVREAMPEGLVRYSEIEAEDLQPV